MKRFWVPQVGTPTCEVTLEQPNLNYQNKEDRPMHRRQMKRHNVSGAARFLTFSCYQQLPLFKNDKVKDHFVDRFRNTVHRFNIEVFAWVIMPEHVHMIVCDDSDSITMTRLTHALKRPFALEVLNRWRKINAVILSKLTHGDGHRFWQTGGGYDRAVVDVELLGKIRYIHANPVERELVKNPEDYRWSSAGCYAGGSYNGPPISIDRLP
ncbi:MAG TPA: transposase, partial [Tepidisphaeraceae bacterium]|nr:transposase [Tepidisphaeraceae bacterium]